MERAEVISMDILSFFDGKGYELGLYERLAGKLMALYPNTVIKVQKTQISFYDKRMYACASLTPVRRKAERPARFVTVTFSLDAPLQSARALAVKVRENRWTHHVLVGGKEEIDEELMGWVAKSHALSAER